MSETKQVITTTPTQGTREAKQAIDRIREAAYEMAIIKEMINPRARAEEAVERYRDDNELYVCSLGRAAHELENAVIAEAIRCGGTQAEAETLGDVSNEECMDRYDWEEAMTEEGLQKINAWCITKVAEVTETYQGDGVIAATWKLAQEEINNAYQARKEIGELSAMARYAQEKLEQARKRYSDMPNRATLAFYRIR